MQASTTERPLRKGREYTLTADAAAFEGGCVARFEGMAVFVSGCVPGDTVRALVTKTKSRYAEARTLEVLAPSPSRVTPPCAYFGTCGGCKWQNLAYGEQLRWKRQHVIDAFERIAGLEDVEVRMTVANAEEYWYRNKMEFSFGDQRWLTEDEIASGRELRRDFALGLHVPGRFDRVLDVERCWLESELSNRVLNATRSFALENGLSIYGTRTHVGLLRNLVIRQSRATGETMIVLVTSDDATETVDRYARFIQVELPEVTTIVQGINRKKAQIAFSEETRVLHGPGTITERVAGNEFTISPFSFFQTNSLQAERLYEHALEAAEIHESKVVWDLYCGAGTITLAAARRARTALGIELNAVAIDDARANAMRNGIENVEFIAGDLKEVLEELRATEAGAATPHHLVRPDVVITDPPRAGMHEDVVRRLLELAPERIAYVSCNPTTQARDCAILSEAYRIEYVQPVDMFPQTYHVETVARLVRR
jgi:23S rRNA (uracil1939-C5)-methyltransferase